MYINMPPPKTPIKIITMCISPQYYCLKLCKWLSTGAFDSAKRYPRRRIIISVVGGRHESHRGCCCCCCCFQRIRILCRVVHSKQQNALKNVKPLRNCCSIRGQMNDTYRRQVLSGGSLGWVLCSIVERLQSVKKIVIILRHCIEKCEIFKELFVG